MLLPSLVNLSLHGTESIEVQQRVVAPMPMHERNRIISFVFNVKDKTLTISVRPQKKEFGEDIKLLIKEFILCEGSEVRNEGDKTIVSVVLMWFIDVGIVISKIRDVYGGRHRVAKRIIVLDDDSDDSD